MQHAELQSIHLLQQYSQIIPAPDIEVGKHDLDLLFESPVSFFQVLFDTTKTLLFEDLLLLLDKLIHHKALIFKFSSRNEYSILLYR
jgi:hypothetical protein